MQLGCQLRLLFQSCDVKAAAANKANVKTDVGLRRCGSQKAERVLTSKAEPALRAVVEDKANLKTDAELTGGVESKTTQVSGGTSFGAIRGMEDGYCEVCKTAC